MKRILILMILENGHLTVPRWILRGRATKGDGTCRSEATAEVSYEADYFYGDYHSSRMGRISVCSVFATGR